jgi:hypothetical protein
MRKCLQVIYGGVHVSSSASQLVSGPRYPKPSWRTDMKQSLEPRKLDAGQAPDLRLIIEPDPRLRDRIGQLDREASQALHAFESLRDFPKIVTDMHDKLGELRRRIEHQEARPAPKERADLVLACFDIRAGAFLRLVSSIEIQNAFLVAIRQFQRIAWQEYVGLDVPAELVQAEGSESLAMEKAIFERGQFWVTKGYKRLENAADSALESVSRCASAADKTEAVADRSAAVDAFLDRCNRESNLQIVLNRTHFWRAAKHKHPRQFQYWQSHNSKATKGNEREFADLLRMGTDEFTARLKKLLII